MIRTPEDDHVDVHAAAPSFCEGDVHRPPQGAGGVVPSRRHPVARAPEHQEQWGRTPTADDPSSLSSPSRSKKDDGAVAVSAAVDREVQHRATTGRVPPDGDPPEV